MAWSTRQLAELAGTTLRAVRHYHEVGLLAEPDRGSNGYKQYGVAHLVRLLRIKRLADLGFSLSQIAEMGEADDHPEEAVAVLDAELAATIDRLQRIRAELSTVLSKRTPTDLPAELAHTAAGMPEADRALTVVLSRVYGPDSMKIWREIVESQGPTPATLAYDSATEDSDDATRQWIAEQLVEQLREAHRKNPEFATLGADAPGGTDFAIQAINVALVDLYNPAQIDILQRVARLLHGAKQGSRG